MSQKENIPSGSLKLATQIKTPLQLAALIVLAFAGILSTLVYKLDSEKFVIYFTIIIVIAGLLVFGIYVLWQRAKIKEDNIEKKISDIKTEAESKISEAVDAFTPRDRRPLFQQKTFMSAPMASLSKENYDLIKEKIKGIKKELRENAGQLDVYWGGDAFLDNSYWDKPAEALEGTLSKIKDCDNFVLVLPEYSCKSDERGYCKPSSIWWEAGIAIAYRKNCLFFIHRSIAEGKEGDDMPYYLRGIQVGFRRGILPPSKVVIFESLENIKKHIKDAGMEGVFPT